MSRRMWPPFISLRTFFWAVPLLFAFFSNPALACRDCPFPLLIEHGRWLMPAGVVEIRMTESITRKSMILSRLEVLSRSGQVLAFGYKQSRPDENEVTIRLFEVTGQGVWMAYINFPKPDERNRIQLRLRCLTLGQCMLNESDFN